MSACAFLDSLIIIFGDDSVDRLEKVEIDGPRRAAEGPNLLRQQLLLVDAIPPLVSTPLARMINRCLASPGNVVGK